MSSEVGTVRRNPETGAIAMLRHGNQLTGPMWFLVPLEDDPRWALASETVEIRDWWVTIARPNDVTANPMVNDLERKA
jgi:hypothetical protein